MIESFGDEATRDVFLAFSTRDARRLPVDLWASIRRRLAMVNAATKVTDLAAPPGNHLEALKGGQEGTWSIRVNDQWRITFRFEGANAHDVTCEDYH